MTSETFYTVEEIADQLRVSIYTVREWIKAGKLEAVKVGKHYRVSETQLNNYLEANKTKK